MIENRSAPPGPIVPVLTYDDVARAIEWLCGAFGFTERLRTPTQPDGTIHHAQIAVGQGAVMLTGSRGARPSGQGLFVPVPDVDAHCERATRFGAQIVNPPRSCEFGERQYTAEDPEGYRWTFSQSVADTRPEDWGAKVSMMKSRAELLPRPRLCYLEIPAADVHQSAGFYGRVFGWNIRRRESDRPSFDDAAGDVSGAWVKDRPPAREPGLLPYIWVDDIQTTLTRVIDAGGEAVHAPKSDTPGGDAIVAAFRDPAGNLIGLYQPVAR